MQETYSVEEVAEICKVSPSAIRARIISLGIQSDRIKKRGSPLKLTPEEVDIIEYKGLNPSKKSFNFNSELYSRKKIFVIECFLRFKNNSTKEIARHLDIKESYVSRVVNEYLENNSTILVRSREI